ncbi:IS91 family transposase [Labilibacter marinus]|uniref:IS91 family transposase n=1 Tax=Labilibacter marinus TaxID=1477105 RepID=UPI00094FD0C2|nr:IS91 family transposase [Labilibacter marinus]
MVSKFELADVIKRFGKQLIQQQKLSPQQTKALFNITRCRTAALGGHQEVCDCCGVVDYSYNSCGDRHCPKCLAAKQALWVEKLIASTLPIKHYHIIFTVPHCLNSICLWNKRMYYNILFDAVWQTLRSFGYTHYGVESGAIAVLHSWGQNLCLHPHIHCIVPAAGYAINGTWKNIGTEQLYLYPVNQLSDTFKGKFLDKLKRTLRKNSALHMFNQAIQQAYQKSWVVFCEASLADADHVIKYLGQYTHRVAISNQRILNITDTHVTFITKDYRDRAKQRPITLRGVEFLKRFCLHVLPKRFVKIRRYGIYNATTKRHLKLQFAPQNQVDLSKPEILKTKETAQEVLKRITNYDPYKCRHCLKGTMRVIKTIPRSRSPTQHMPSLLYMLMQ